MRQCDIALTNSTDISIAHKCIEFQKLIFWQAVKWYPQSTSLAVPGALTHKMQNCQAKCLINTNWTERILGYWIRISFPLGFQFGWEIFKWDYWQQIKDDDDNEMMMSIGG